MNGVVALNNASRSLGVVEPTSAKTPTNASSFICFTDRKSRRQPLSHFLTQGLVLKRIPVTLADCLAKINRSASVGPRCHLFERRGGSFPASFKKRGTKGKQRKTVPPKLLSVGEKGRSGSWGDVIRALAHSSLSQ